MPVVLELEPVLGGYCALPPRDISRVFGAPSWIERSTIEDRDAFVARSNGRLK